MLQKFLVLSAIPLTFAEYACWTQKSGKYAGEYCGNWVNDKLEGQGKYTSKKYDESFVGEYHKDRMVYGTWNDRDGSKYKGPFKNGKADGFGEYWSESGDYYKGNFKNDEFNGQGIYHKKSGDYAGKYLGQWEDSELNGQGSWIGEGEWAGYSYVGEWEDDEFNGYGVYTTPKGEHKGQWNDGELEGAGFFDSWF